MKDKKLTIKELRKLRGNNIMNLNFLMVKKKENHQSSFGADSLRVRIFLKLD